MASSAPSGSLDATAPPAAIGLDATAVVSGTMAAPPGSAAAAAAAGIGSVSSGEVL
jgi:hypothetical protein